MAININIPDHRNRLSRALRKSFTDAAPSRRIRQNLLDIYRDKCNPAFESASNESEELGTLLNLFQKFVRGHLLTLAFNLPKWAINAKTMDGRGLDRKMQAFLGRYAEILNFNKVQKQLALDSAFGWAVCKVTDGIPPKGITAPVSPRLYRINPDMLIVDPQAATIDECSFVGDVYLVPLNEARSHPNFDLEQAAKLQEFRMNASSAASYAPSGASNTDAFAEPMTRLLDVYIPKTGTIHTWPCPDDEFRHVKTEGPLGSRPSKINPYCLLNLLEMPGFLIELARLRSLRGLHLVANEMLDKGIQQARASQRNPVAPLGSEQDMATALQAGDNNPIYLEDKEQLGMFTIPGPDVSILNLGLSSAKLFSSEAGNLEVALGASAGADTARQTEALLGQISASQSLDRKAFEEFLAEIGRKMLVLAFENDDLEVETVERVPGTNISFSRLWAGPTKMPRMAKIDTFAFSIVPHSTAFRTPQERVKQLNEASQLIVQFMAAKAQGMPIAIDAVMRDVGDAFDLLPNLMEWWNGQEPTPQEQTASVYQSTAGPAQGSDIRYQGNQSGGGDQVETARPYQNQGGVS